MVSVAVFAVACGLCTIEVLDLVGEIPSAVIDPQSASVLLTFASALAACIGGGSEFPFENTNKPAAMIAAVDDPDHSSCLRRRCRWLVRTNGKQLPLTLPVHYSSELTQMTRNVLNRGLFIFENVTVMRPNAPNFVSS